MEDKTIELINTAIEEGDDLVPVDSGLLLIVDPCRLPDELLEQLLTPDAYDWRMAAVVPSICGDGIFAVDYEEGDDERAEDAYLKVRRWPSKED